MPLSIFFTVFFFLLPQIDVLNFVRDKLHSLWILLDIVLETQL